MNLTKLALISLGLSPLGASSPIETSPEPLNIALSSTFGSRSHIKYLFEIAQHLRNRGHNIIYAAPQGNFKFNKPYNYTEYDIGGVIHNTRDLMKTFDIEEMIKDSMKIMSKHFTNITTYYYEETFNNYEKFYKSQKIDLIICDFFSPVCIDSARKSGVPLIGGFQGLSFGVGSAPFITNTMDSSPTTTESLSFYQRFKQAVIDPLKMIYDFSDFANKMNEARKKFGVPQVPNPFGAFDEIMKISNTYIGFDEPRPISSTLKLVGPVMDDYIPQLGEDLQSFLDSHKSMYVAFGSAAVLNERILKKLASSMQLAIDSGAVEGVLWGLGNTNHEDFPKTYEVNGHTYSTKSILDGTHPYIKALSWAPQTAILNHQNTKLFISHGGIESSHEAIHSGTPILLMPMFGDQPRNARLIKNRGIGDFVDTLTATPHDLLEKIKDLTREDNYILQDKVKHIQSISHDRNSMRENNAKFIENYAISAKICRKSHHKNLLRLLAN
ncbi:glycosyltransferase family 1 protein [Conidiobolus coronatus NRRL 28638]|uniref:Glycosyltransferase family 1 protein n=1 Tax=Conidiobolus coronatus (strain ATCC 28846 / CBS 209.66 / NRRL 28638) TaxID=796925 RepID=A0A137NR69_CONC2|nr:glycosyltransferase family 1 protein [Conidiobolus coronatus NRRL 28638]|eukprot:KXN65266.1 glycosyltransferase family 1 protein [Conidiobolus coronatus NRRL 28638]